MSNLTDRELLEMAAKAFFIKLQWSEDGRAFQIIRGLRFSWNPLDDDGDALRLAVNMSGLEGGLALMLNSRLDSSGFAKCYTSEVVVATSEYMREKPYAATRRAITRAAAEIGRAMP